MDDCVNATRKIISQTFIDILLDKDEAIILGQIAQLAGDKVVNNNDLIVLGQKKLRYMRPNESGTSGDNYPQRSRPRVCSRINI